MENQTKNTDFTKEYNEIKEGIVSLYSDAKIGNNDFGEALVYDTMTCHITGVDENGKYNMSFLSSQFRDDDSTMSEDSISVEDATIPEVIEFIMTNPPNKILNYFK